MMFFDILVWYYSLMSYNLFLSTGVLYGRQQQQHQQLPERRILQSNMLQHVTNIQRQQQQPRQLITHMSTTGIDTLNDEDMVLLELHPPTQEDHVYFPYDYQTINQSPRSKSSSATEDSTIRWKPSNYPNPINDPERCMISSLLSKQQTKPADKSKKPLLLCDPDNNLAPDDLEQIAISIWDFPRMEVTSSTNSFLAGCASSIITPTITTTTTAIGKDQQQISNSSNNSTDDNIIPKLEIKESITLNINYAEIQVAVAIVSKLDLRSVFLDNTWHSYQDQADLFNDATQYFSRFLYDQWMSASASPENNVCSQKLGILIFVSVKDCTCNIVSGLAVESVIPWWRMQYVTNEIKVGLRQQQQQQQKQINYGETILEAIGDLRIFIEMGPPTMTDRIGDFFKRFGVVVGFSLFAFTCAFGIEYGDRLRRWHIIEKRSKLSPGDKIRAMSLQEDYHCYGCPICLEEFQTNLSSTGNHNNSGENQDTAIEIIYNTVQETTSVRNNNNNNEESIPLFGSDGLPLKLLRCGHAFDYTCWKCWIDKGNGDPFKCPVCRQDICSPCTSTSKRESCPNSRMSLNNRSNNHPDYESVANRRFRSETRQHRQSNTAVQHSRTVSRSSMRLVINGDGERIDRDRERIDHVFGDMDRLVM